MIATLKFMGSVESVHSQPRNYNSACDAKRQSGVGLVEVLIAVVIASIGLLAAAKIQLEGMRFSQSAYYQSQAHFMANDMIDRMLGNIEGVANGFYDNKSTSAGASKPGCTNCTPSQVAQLDLYDWSLNLFPLEGAGGFVSALPHGKNPANAQIIPLGDEQYAMDITWTEVVNGTDKEQRFRLQFELENGEI